MTKRWTNRFAAVGVFGLLLAGALPGLGSSSHLASGNQSDDSSAGEEGDPPAPYNDKADSGTPGLLDLDVHKQVARILNVPTSVARQDGFGVTLQFSGAGVSPGYNIMCTAKARAFNGVTSVWEAVSGTSYTAVWTWDPIDNRWENGGTPTIAYTHTITDNGLAQPHHTKYSLYHECEDPDHQPAADKIRVAVVFSRTA